MRSLSRLSVPAMIAAAIAIMPAIAHADTITHYTADSGTAVQVAPRHENETDAVCNTGDTVTGGGALLEDGYWIDEPYMRVVQSGPIGSSGGGPPTGWRVTYHNEDSEDPHGFVVYVICEHTVAE